MAIENTGFETSVIIEAKTTAKPTRQAIPPTALMSLNILVCKGIRTGDRHIVTKKDF